MSRTISSAIKAVVYAPIGHSSSNVFLNRDITKFFGINTVSGTQVLGHDKLVRVDIDGDDFRCSCHLGTLNDSKSLKGEINGN